MKKKNNLNILVAYEVDISHQRLCCTLLHALFPSVSSGCIICSQLIRNQREKMDFEVSVGSDPVLISHRA